MADPAVLLKIDHILRSKQIHRPKQMKKQKKNKKAKPKEQFLSVQRPLGSQLFFRE